MGMRAILLSDFSANTMRYQLALATQAHVVVGLHGAGLVNVLFTQKPSILVELRSPYGYQSDLFALAAETRSLNVSSLIDDNIITRVRLYLLVSLINIDATFSFLFRSALYLSLDIRNYDDGRGSLLPIDSSLVSRVTNGLQIALSMQEKKQISMPLTRILMNSSNPAETVMDIILAATDNFIPIESMSLGGPNAQTLSSFCKRLPVSVYRKMVDNTERWCGD